MRVGAAAVSDFWLSRLLSGLAVFCKVEREKTGHAILSRSVQQGCYRFSKVRADSHATQQPHNRIKRTRSHCR